MIFDGLFLIFFANNKKHPGEIFFLFNFPNKFRKIKFSDIRNQGAIKLKAKNEDIKNTWVFNKKHKNKKNH
jgi:hypothetical protein